MKAARADKKLTRSVDALGNAAIGGHVDADTLDSIGGAVVKALANRGVVAKFLERIGVVAPPDERVRKLFALAHTDLVKSLGDEGPRLEPRQVLAWGLSEAGYNFKGNTLQNGDNPIFNAKGE